MALPLARRDPRRSARAPADAERRARPRRRSGGARRESEARTPEAKTGGRNSSSRLAALQLVVVLPLVVSLPLRVDGHPRAVVVDLLAQGASADPVHPEEAQAILRPPRNHLCRRLRILV